jgi:hypothetical protein
MNILNRSIAVLLIAVLTLIGCGGGDSGGGGGAANVTGKFVDATVVGMGYKCGTSTTLGTTNAAGEFTCPAGQAVAFYVGDILIGSVASATAVVTPLDLVGANATPANAQVANIVRFLMSISSTVPSPTGTLTIDPTVVALAAGKTIDFATATTALDTLITTLKPGATVYSNAQATAHVTSSINGLFTGNYSGTYSGAQNGTWSISIDANGVVTGSVDGVAGEVTGNMATTLSTGSTYGFTGTGSGFPWVGTLNVSTKVFSGTWNGAGGGTFTGTASTPAGGGGITTCVSSHYSVPVHAPTATELAVYAKTYNGSVGNFGPNIGDPFVATGPAAFVLSAAGGLTYNGATKLVTSMCLENTPTTGAPLYVEMQPSDHVDLFTDGGFTGVLAPNVVKGGSCLTTCGAGGTGGTTPTVTGFSPNTGAVGTTVTITGTNLGLGFPPAPIVKFGATAVTTALTFNGQTSISFAVPAGLAAGAHAITIGGATGTPITVGTFTVTAGGGGAGGAGLTLSPAFNAIASFPNSVPNQSTVNAGGTIGTTLKYLQGTTALMIQHSAPANGSSPLLTVTFAQPGTFMSTLNSTITIGGTITLNSVTCAVAADPNQALCSSLGVTFNKATGTVGFNNTSMQSPVGDGVTLFRFTGNLTFAPF